MNNEMVILTKENFNEIFNRVVQGTIASRYNSLCFNVSDITRELQAKNEMEDLMEAVYQAGYDPYALCKEILAANGLDYTATQDPLKKQKLDSNFNITVKLTYSLTFV
ncbi:hypothetical protein [Bacillus cereus]|uniref:Uncharacterized protein n=1 Tax=Bacillus cereus 03BB108 TaxID=451709 RepID=A0AAN0W4Y5_BACCE|nr:hypothetical protein [Bacillus cereus]AJI08817.1 hypothetical protein AK40_5588 [Bacillus cereus 03BB108]EDX59940.1 hypothetical protein BC03BB108_B0234 [Bacillus cereus 03BB108]MCC3686891.1 hypothetical protein [Bacillus cereus]QKG99077.1 hypothetical protein FOC96_02150 [Bacillus cereus]